MKATQVQIFEKIEKKKAAKQARLERNSRRTRMEVPKADEKGRPEPKHVNIPLKNSSKDKRLITIEEEEKVAESESSLDVDAMIEVCDENIRKTRENLRA